MIYTMSPARVDLKLCSDRLLITAASEIPLVQLNIFGPLVKSEQIFYAPMMKKKMYSLKSTAGYS
jgi:hypothetical protein